MLYLAPRMVVAVAFLLFFVFSLPAHANNEVQQRWETYFERYLAGRDVTEFADFLNAEVSTPNARMRTESPARLSSSYQAFLPKLAEALAQDQASVWFLKPHYERLKAEHLLFRSYLNEVDEKAHKLGALDRNSFSDQYSNLVSPLFEGLDAFFESYEKVGGGSVITDLGAIFTNYFEIRNIRSVALELSALIDPPYQPIIRSTGLPYGPLSLSSKALVKEPVETPSYQQPSGPEPTAADLQATSQAPLQEAVLLLAEELNYDPAAIFEFVHNNIAREWYSGAMKGALGTLEQRAGNSVDQASLLIALLRASSIPSRYVHGVVEMQIEQLRSELGIDDPNAIVRAIRASGVPVQSIVRGGRIDAIEVEHTWVSAYVPYANYRGATVDRSGKLWLPLDPSQKAYSYTAPTAVLGTVEEDLAAISASYFNSIQTDSPLAKIRALVEQTVAQAGESYKAQLGSRIIEQEPLRYLPNSLKTPVVAITKEESELSAQWLQTLEFRVFSSVNAIDDPVLEASIPVSELASRRVTISYLPASSDDHNTVNSFGGLDAVPPGLVKLRPQIKVAGKLVAVSEQPVDMAAWQRLEVSIRSAYHTETVVKNILAGGYEALAVSAQKVTQTGEKNLIGDTEYLAAQLLSQSALRYLKAWDQTEAELAALSGQVLIKPLPSLVFVGQNLSVDRVLGVPQLINWHGVTMDAAFRVSEVMPASANALSAQQFRQLSALQGSFLEHAQFESDFTVASVSADKAIAVARGQGLDVLSLVAPDSAQLSSLSHPQPVVDAVQEWLSLGYQVDLPVSPVTYENWTGSAWVVTDTATGAQGYFLSGGIAGGQSASIAWPEGLKNALINEYSEPPETNTDLVARLLMIPSTDVQTGAAGQQGEELKVLAQTVDGRPVVGASVVFKRELGGLRLVDPEDPESGADLDEVTVITDNNGIASVAFVHGTDTGRSSLFRRTDPKLVFSERVSYNTVTASHEKAALQSPFTVYTTAGELADLNLLSDGLSNRPGAWADTLRVMPVDEFGNPISNVEVTFSTGSPSRALKAGSLNARVTGDGLDTCPAIPSVWNCGVSISTTLSSPLYGAVTYLFNGSESGVVYRWHVSAGSITKTVSNEVAAASAREIRLQFAYQMAADGSVGASAKVGELYPAPLKFALSRYDRSAGFDTPDGTQYQYELEPVSFEGTPALTVNQRDPESGEVVESGSAFNLLQTQPGQYQMRLQMGNQPGLNRVLVSGDIVGEDQPFSGLAGLGYGIEPQIVAHQQPEGFKLDANNISERSLELFHTVLPPSYSDPNRRVYIYADDQLIGTTVDEGKADATHQVARLPSGLLIDTEKQYTARLVFNRGSTFEIASDPYPIPVSQKTILFPRQDGLITARREVDLMNEWVCDSSTDFVFRLSHPATVTVDLTSPLGGITTNLVTDVDFAKGVHEIDLPLSTLNEGYYRFTMSTVSSLDGHTEQVEGYVAVQYNLESNLPVGHAIEENVDLFDGHLFLSRTDLSIKSRGPDLKFQRFYSSNNRQNSTLGAAWGHNFDSQVRDIGCGAVAISGGVGGGRYFPDGQGGYRPQKGLHGDLQRVNASDRWVFTAKDGTRYHYEKYRFNARSWQLAYVEDTNGNTLALGYDPAAKDPRLMVVKDSSGRALEFEYAPKPSGFRFLNNHLITRIKAPNGIELLFDYDDHGRLIKSTKQGGGEPVVESYRYDALSLFAVEPQYFNDLNAVTTPNGHQVEYEYNIQNILVRATSSFAVPISAVTRITRHQPVSGNEVINFTYGDRGTRTGDLTARVNRGSGRVKDYVLDQYGAPLSITGPAGTVSMTWAPDDVVMTSRTNERGITTSFTHDEWGNVLSEETEGMPPITRNYAVIGDTRIRDRVAEETGLNGETTKYEYDGAGNLTSISHPGGHKESFSYASNGDRLNHKDRNGNVRAFTYDTHGYVATVANALYCCDESEWNVLGLKTSETNGRGATTSYRYDGLGRMIGMTDAEGGESSFTYDAQDNLLSQKEPEGRQTFWEYNARDQVTEIRKSLAGGFIAKQNQYDAYGNLTAESDWLADKNWTYYEYDAANRQTAVTKADGEGNERRIEKSYDGVGNLTRKDFDLGRYEAYQYDNLDRLTLVTDALGNESRKVVRDDLGKTVTEYDALGRQTVTRFDGLGRPIVTERIVNGSPNRRIARSFDGNGNLVEELNPIGRLTENRYDELDRKIQETLSSDYGSALSRTYFSYDNAGNLTRKVNGRTVAEVMTYDALNRLTSREFPAGSGEVYAYDYDKVGNRTRETWPNGNLVTMTYDELNRLDTKSDLLGLLEDRDHDANGNVIRRLDANGNVTTSEYNALNELRVRNLPENRKEERTYDLVGNLVTQSRATASGDRVSQTVYTYDLLNRKETETDPLGYTVTYGYDDVGNLLSVKDKRNNSTTHTYDELDNRVTTTDPNGDSLSFEYDLVGNRTKETDKKGHVTARAYDVLNRETRVERNDLVILQNEYDEVGNLITETDAKGNVTVRVYDSANRVIELSREESSLTRYAYDRMGNRTAECDPESRATNWRYDVRGRQIFAINNLGQTTTYAYDGNGNRTAETRPKGNSTESATCGYSETLAATYPGDSANYTWHYGYDSADRLSSVTDGNGEQTLYTHNYLDLRTSHTDALNQTTAMAYDAVGNLVSVTYADGKQEQYTAYDGNGNLKAMTDARGSVVSYDYDTLNRETLRAFTPITPLAQEVLQVATAYDKNGNVVTITETDTVGDTRVTTQAYDRFDRLIRREDSFGKVTSYAYDNNGNRTQLTDPDLNVTRYTFDKLNRVSTVTTLQGTTSYTYDKSGLRRTVAYPGNAVMAYQYDAVGRTDTITHSQNSAQVSKYHYEYDTHGNRTRQEEENGRGLEVSTYAYDNLDRLTQVTYPDVPVGTGTTVLYTYDSAYNRTGETTLNVEATTIADKTYRYNNRNQLTAVDDNLDPGQNVTYDFDANGNQVAKTKATVATDFVYDVRDNLRSVTTGGSTVGQFLYDYRGMRIEKDGARGIERYSYDDQSVLTQFDETGATLAKFEYGGNRLISLNSLENGLQFYHFDALGSPVTLTKADGSVQARYSYDAWGHKRFQNGESWNRFGFTGHEHDEETNLIYAKARYYDPDTGRFLSQDPWEGDTTIAPSLNKYLYAYVNPLVYVDPDGREAFPLFNVPVNEETDLVTPFTRIDTGNVVADHMLAFAASVPNFGYMAVNGLSNGLSLPLQGYAAARGKSLDEADAEITAHLASTGPLAPILLTGSAPFRAPATLSRIRRNLNVVEETQTVRHAELVEESASRSGSNLAFDTYRDTNGRLRNSANNRFVRDPESAASRGELTPTQTLRRDQQAQFNVNRKEVLQEEQLCPYCQTNSQEAVDHIVSVEQGQKIVERGTASREEILEFLPSIDNLTGACTTCNSGAGGRVKTSGEAVEATRWQMVNPTPEIERRVEDLNKRFDLE